MARNSRHPEYEKAAPVWKRARDVFAGEDAVKAAGEKYLPRIDSQSDDDFAIYKARASFFGATARTLEEYLDLVFRRAPMVGFGERKALEAFVANCDLWGMDFLRYAREVVGEVLSVGRCGSLVLWDEAGKRPWVSLWRAEDIINWTVERVGQGVTLTGVVLCEGSRVRVLRVVEGLCIQEVWEQRGEEWLLVESVTVLRDAVPLRFIPFVFHGPRNSRPEPDRLPLADIIAANLDHYRLDADYKHGLHFAALPTAWVSGFDKGRDSADWFEHGVGLGHSGCDGWFSGVQRRRAWSTSSAQWKRWSDGWRCLGRECWRWRRPGGEPATGLRGELCGLGNLWRA